MHCNCHAARSAAQRRAVMHRRYMKRNSTWPPGGGGRWHREGSRGGGGTTMTSTIGQGQRGRGATRRRWAGMGEGVQEQAVAHGVVDGWQVGWPREPPLCCRVARLLLARHHDEGPPMGNGWALRADNRARVRGGGARGTGAAVGRAARGRRWRPSPSSGTLSAPHTHPPTCRGGADGSAASRQTRPRSGHVPVGAAAAWRAAAVDEAAAVAAPRCADNMLKLHPRPGKDARR